METVKPFTLSELSFENTRVPVIIVSSLNRKVLADVGYRSEREPVPIKMLFIISALPVR
jgi:hypothetical protein